MLAALLYLTELDQLPGIHKTDHAQLCQEVSQTFRPPHPLSCHHVRQGSQESMEEHSLPQLIYISVALQSITEKWALLQARNKR